MGLLIFNRKKMGCCSSKSSLRDAPPLPAPVEMQAYPVTMDPLPPPPYPGLQPPPPVYQAQHQPQAYIVPPPQPYNRYQPPPPQPFAEYFSYWQIQPHYWNDLMQLSAYDIVIICDDSGSMNEATENGNTRWSELINMLRAVVTLGCLLDTNGIDVIFLNRGMRRNVTSIEQINYMLVQPPGDRTPLSRRCLEAFSMKPADKPQLLLIATDGQPNTCDDPRDPEYDSVQRFYSTIATELYRPDHSFISILKCSGDERETGYLDQMDRDLPHLGKYYTSKNILKFTHLCLDVIDDYLSERDEVLRKQGSNFVYTPGDNIARFLLGAIYPRYDNMDEKFVE